MARTRSGADGRVTHMQQTRAAPLTTLDAVLERITYANQETGYTVARVATDRSSDLLTVVGALLGAQPGESLHLQGRWTSHPQYGRQFQVDTYTTVLPATIQGIRRYLGSGLIKGIGPKMAERIVDHFGQATLQVIEEDPTRLIEVPGLGPKRTGMITAAWEEQKAIKARRGSSRPRSSTSWSGRTCARSCNVRSWSRRRWSAPTAAP